jgi:hypothetical protein
LRTDAVIINNPCSAQEFGFAVGGRIYIVEEFLKNHETNIIDIILPGINYQDSSDERRVKEELQHKVRINISLRFTYAQCPENIGPYSFAS